MKNCDIKNASFIAADTMRYAIYDMIYEIMSAMAIFDNNLTSQDLLNPPSDLKQVCGHTSW